MKKLQPAPAKRQDNKNLLISGLLLKYNKAFAVVPPLYRKPMYTLIQIMLEKRLDMIPLQTVFWVFGGYRINEKKTKIAIWELHKLGILRVIHNLDTRMVIGIRLKGMEK